MLDTESAAAYLSICKRSMQKLLDVSGGPIRTVAIGRARRVPVQCLDEYIEELTSG